MNQQRDAKEQSVNIGDQQLVLLTENQAQDKTEPTDEEVKLYGQLLGLEVEGQDSNLRWIAVQGLKAPLPNNWKACQTTQESKILYLNTLTSEVTPQHPLDTYFQALASREQSLQQSSSSGFKHKLVQAPPQSDVVLSDSCISKANQTLISIFRLQNDLQQQYRLLLNKAQEQLQQELRQDLKKLSHQEKHNLYEKEQQIGRAYSQQLSELQHQFRLRQEQTIEQIKQQYDGIIDEMQKSANTSSGTQKGDLLVKQVEMIRKQEQLKADKQMIDIKEEFKDILEECKESIKMEVLRSKEATKEHFEDKFEKMQQYMKSIYNKKKDNTTKWKTALEADNIQRAAKERQLIKSSVRDQVEERRNFHEQQLKEDKEKLELQVKQHWVNKEVQLSGPAPLHAQMMKDYKEEKELQVKLLKKQIKEEHREQLFQLQMQSKLTQTGNSQKEVLSMIDQMQSQSLQLKQRQDELKDQIQREKQYQQKDTGNQFVTIADIEQVQQDQYKSYIEQHQVSNTKPKNLSMEFNQITNYKKPPLSRSPTPSKDSFVSRVIESRSQTPSSSVTQQIAFMTSEKSDFEIIDRYKMKEIRQYVANELFKSNQKSQQLLADFSKTKRLREEMFQLNQQTTFVIPASYGAKKRGRQVDYELEVQFNSIRTQLRNVQSKHEVLKRMKENINKHQQCLQAREKQRIETEVLNDYNYLRAKTRKDNERAKSSLSNSFSLDATPESGISMISGENDSDRFYRKWEKIIKSGMESDTSSLNPYAVQMLPKEDPKIQTINRLQKALKDLGKLPKSNLTLDYRTRMAKKGKNGNGIHHMLQTQQQWLKAMKTQLVQPIGVGKPSVRIY